MTIYIGNLNYRASEQEIAVLFENYGTVDSVKLVVDRETGKARGFGFVEMRDNSEAKKAIESLHETEFLGRSLTVNEAKPRS